MHDQAVYRWYHGNVLTWVMFSLPCLLAEAFIRWRSDTKYMTRHTASSIQYWQAGLHLSMHASTGPSTGVLCFHSRGGNCETHTTEMQQILNWCCKWALWVHGVRAADIGLWSSFRNQKGNSMSSSRVLWRNDKTYDAIKKWKHTQGERTCS